jgi:peptidoglycan/LPS O-acetylase OafA/YrhL
MEINTNDHLPQVDSIPAFTCIPAKKCKIKYITTIVQPAETLRIVSEVRTRPEYFPALTGLRFFLALWVILHHLVGKGMMLDLWNQSLPYPARIFFEQGHVAVRTFFVLSGFVLTQGYAFSRWRREDLMSYGVARVSRIFPVYLLSLAIVAFFILQFLVSPATSVGGKLTTVTVYGLVLQGWMRNPGAGWNTPAWSLSCEFFFYLCLPPLLIWLGRRSRVKLVALTVAALVLPILLRRAGVPLTWKPILHLGDFLVGIAAARIYSLLRTSRIGRRHLGHWLYLPAMALGTLVIVCPELLYGVGDLGTVLRPLNGVLVLGLALGGGAFARFLSTGAAQYLGQVSYSMYILHVPLLWWFGNHGPVPVVNFQVGMALIYIVGIVLVSMAAYEWVEKPANRRLRDWSRRRLSPVT